MNFSFFIFHFLILNFYFSIYNQGSLMEFTLITPQEERLTLPAPLSFVLQYGMGTPCDSVRVCVPLLSAVDERLVQGLRIEVQEQGVLYFMGVVDEWEHRITHSGCTMELVGRGMAARLLDNQAEGADFAVATVQDILRRYVTPYGIAVEGTPKLPGVNGFSVQSGSSCWAVVEDFARYYGGITQIGRAHV